MSQPTVSKADLEWQAEEDFRTLANAEEVKADRARLAKAKRAGKDIIKKEERALKSKKRVATPSAKGKRK